MRDLLIIDLCATEKNIQESTRPTDLQTKAKGNAKLSKNKRQQPQYRSFRIKMRSIQFRTNDILFRSFRIQKCVLRSLVRCSLDFWLFRCLLFNNRMCICAWAKQLLMLVCVSVCWARFMGLGKAKIARRNFVFG